MSAGPDQVGGPTVSVPLAQMKDVSKELDILAKVRALVDRYAAAGYIDVATLRGIVHPAQDGV